MSTLRELTTARRLGHSSLALAFALALGACSTSGTSTTKPATVAKNDSGGFTITENVKVSSSVRSDFKTAVQLLEQGENESAIAVLVELSDAAPRVTSVQIDLAIAYGRVGDLERAEASIKRALQLNPRHPVAHNELGILYRKSGRFEKARDSYQRALGIHPDFHFARRNLAILCDVYLGDLPCALENYEAYSRSVPDDEDVAMWIADLKNRGGE
jgi:Flp pilus assembly protein TadD